MGLYGKIIDLQKLRKAWDIVRKNKPAVGVDNISWEQFDANANKELKQLNIELVNHSYKALPVKQLTIYKGEKSRDIALYSMRDKVVQQSLNTELSRLYNGRFSGWTYSYISGKSALNAVNSIDEAIRIKHYNYVLKIDIQHFFDEIQWKKLKLVLLNDINEEDVLLLIKENCCGVWLETSTGEIKDKSIGIYQGSGISPILSNIYLMEFDHWLSDRSEFFIRYSDDMIVLGKDEDTMRQMFKDAALQLSKAGLKVNESKTLCVSLESGVDFLGYHFDMRGKAIPAKAEEALKDRLETIWLTSSENDIEFKAKKVLEIIGGWEQYFREDRDVGTIFEFVGLMYSNEGQGLGRNFEKLRKCRPKLENIYVDIMKYLSDIWQEHKCPELELLEYEQFYEMPVKTSDEKVLSSADSADIPASKWNNIREILSNYRQFIVTNSQETARELMQCYTDLRMYENASAWMKKSEEIKSNPVLYPDVIPSIQDNFKDGFKDDFKNSSNESIIYNHKTPAKFLKTFVGREDIYSMETYGENHRRQNDMLMLPLTEKVISEHLNGSATIGTYIQRPNSTVRFIVIDVDISKRVILKYGNKGECFKSYLSKALQMASAILHVIDSMGLKGYIEFSGYRGYHVWLFLTEWMQVRYANLFCEIIESKLPEDNDISLEFFPNKTRLKPGKFGQLVKLPFSIHLKTGKRSLFLSEDLTLITEINPFLDSIARYSPSSIKRVLAASNREDGISDYREVDSDLGIFGELDKNVREVLENCSLLRYLCQKAAKTGYLSHFERLTILYVFGHIGSTGSQFIHKTMSFTLNYSYNVTEKFIRKCPEKPISCVKLRDQYRKVTAEIGCNCAFKRTKNCYPSPVLHAITLSDDIQSDVTLPVARTLSNEKKLQVLDEINVHKKVQQLTGRILELRKQQRALDKNIKAVEKELSTCFDNAQIDTLETDMGVLVRRKVETGYEWIIEI